MKIFIACSKHFYHRIPEIKKQLDKLSKLTSEQYETLDSIKEQLKKSGKDEI